MNLLRIIIALLLAGSLGQAASVYILDGGAGAGTAWNDALDALPSTLTRGNTYYIGDGSYAGYTVDDAVSGTTRITIKKATVADHGTETGWSSTYGDGVAQFTGALSVQASYITVDGGSTVGTYGFYFKAASSTAGVRSGGFSLATLGNILQGIEVENDGTSGARGFFIVKSTEFLMSNCKSWDTDNDALLWQQSGGTIEYSVFGPRTVTSSVHGDALEIQISENTIFRFNRIDWNGQQVFFGGVGDGIHGDWEVYGNLFMNLTGSPSSSCRGLTKQSLATMGETLCYNNTFAGLHLAHDIAGTGAIRNNIYFDMTVAGVSFWDSDHDYNWFETGMTDAAEANDQYGSDPFISAAGGNFSLTAGTTAGATLSSPYDEDLTGAPRGGDGTWDRGALEFGASAPPTSSVAIAATDATATEASTTTGAWTVTFSTLDTFTVNLTMSGDVASGDYSIATMTSGATLGGTHPNYTLDVVDITSAVITLTPVDDMTDEGDELATLTVSSGSGYQIGTPSSASITVVDDDDAPQVATPTFSPTTELNFGAVTVTITDNEGGGADAIYYTTDGTTPDSGDTEYVGTFQLSQGQWVVNAIAVKSGSGDSVVATQTYYVNDFNSLPAFQEVSVGTWADVFTWTFTVTVADDAIDGLIALSTASGVDEFTDLAVIVRFSVDDVVDARDGGAYAADAVFPYSQGSAYDLRVVVDEDAKTYSVDVRESGGGYTRIATDFDFRTEQAAVTDLEYVVWIGSNGGFEVQSLQFVTGAPAAAAQYGKVSIGRGLGSAGGIGP